MNYVGPVNTTWYIIGDQFRDYFYAAKDWIKSIYQSMTH